MQPPSLSEDLQLEIIARTDDPTTVVRCAAASKPLRRAILDPAFRRRRLAVVRAASKGGFDSALVADVSYRIREHGNGRTNDLTAISTSRRLQIDSSLLVSFEPAFSRDGILVLWRNRELERRRRWNGFRPEPEVQLLVCNVFTGDITSRPPQIGARGYKGIAGDVYRPALLTTEKECADDGRFFKLLVMDKYLHIQSFSSQDDGKWDHIHQYKRPAIASCISSQMCSAPAAVIGSTAHWLCHLVKPNPLNVAMIILAVTVNADTAKATAIELPEGCLTSLMESWNASEEDPAKGRLILVTTTTDDKATASRLSLLVAEPMIISMWTLITSGEGSKGWSRQMVIHRHEIKRQLGTGMETYQATMRFKAFAGRSGTVVFWIERVGLVRLSLVTKKAVLVRACSENSQDVQVCLHDVNLASLLSGMKPF
ncbi:hypothetical protein QOZ80_3BG0259040 [Eleusine coracana subsp. coracana]|nr:hypothetical protein QOZ80_3BG0259040 [Eleusine coracana subsp. coracana]